MRADLTPGNTFPDFELPDQDHQPVRLSELMSGWPTILVFTRGHHCPKDIRQLTHYVRDLQPELIVNYCRLITVSVDDPFTTREVREALGATWPFLSDADHRLIFDLDIVDASDKQNGPMAIPFTFVLEGTRQIYKVYNGWWYVGRPTVEELRHDLRALMSRRPDWEYSGDQDDAHLSQAQPAIWPSPGN